ncbi:hypothetical protein ANME2D_00833 [Candidatus Methanoperedens nitroreducens]|uniref:DUF4367 domain-containing protein n=1 Tax=Candidatus Methanoperedens nitratireducens TaxID=1392998 RepID=A0A062UZS5_9EURY|nr:hypothetical protein [Candidatus Methanoperedens nitroreducens]KCZ72406.1 hypothetical protein ANME2D_00833 [Candidatus Methanoperedens nitroreducens]MDJ1423660.1 hypothetical protein [Candidatus Methanoperedens sp.]
MRKNKSELYLALFIIAVLAGTVLLYTQMQEKNAYGMFPEKLGDMSLSLYKEGDVAMTEVKRLHGNSPNVKVESAYIADYRGSMGSKAKFWVSESKNSEEAASLLELMNSSVGKTGMFSESTNSTIEGIKVYFVSGLPELGLYHYFYAKDKRVFWIQIDNPDEAYRKNIVRESIKLI